MDIRNNAPPRRLFHAHSLASATHYYAVCRTTRLHLTNLCIVAIARHTHNAAVCGDLWDILKVMAEGTGGKRRTSPLTFQEIDGRSATADADNRWQDTPADVPDLPQSAQDLEPVYDIPVRVSAVLGRSSMTVSALTTLSRGAVIELDRKVGEAIDIFVNNRLIARGEVVVVDDLLGVTMTEIIKNNRGRS